MLATFSQKVWGKGASGPTTKKSAARHACLTNPFTSAKDHGPTSRLHIAGCSGRKASLETTISPGNHEKGLYTPKFRKHKSTTYWILNIEPIVSMSVELRVYTISWISKNQEYVILSLPHSHVRRLISGKMATYSNTIRVITKRFRVQRL